MGHVVSFHNSNPHSHSSTIPSHHQEAKDSDLMSIFKHYYIRTPTNGLLLLSSDPLIRLYISHAGSPIPLCIPAPPNNKSSVSPAMQNQKRRPVYIE